MEPKLIFWIIGLILYFWIRSKKSSIPGNPETNSKLPPPSSQPKPVSFEDLLREIERSKFPRQEEPRRQQQYPEEFEEENIPAEEIISETEKPSWDYKTEISEELATSEVHTTTRTSLEETMQRGTVDTRAPKFKEYETVEENVFAKKIQNDFKDPDQLRKAFIMGEILNRKWK